MLARQPRQLTAKPAAVTNYRGQNVSNPSHRKHDVPYLPLLWPWPTQVS